MRISGVLSLGVTLACLALVPSPIAAAGPAAIDPNTACATEFSAIKVEGDPNTVVVVASDLPGPFKGTITAYGRNTSWTGTIGRWAMIEVYGSMQSSLAVHAAAPIEAIEYTPAWASCSFRAGARPRSGYDDEREIDRPVLTLSNPQPLAPLSCAKPYMPPVVKSAVEPTSPAAGLSGIAKIAMVVGAQGEVQYTHVLSAPSPEAGRAAEDAARHSTFAPALFRCQPVTGGYEFAVMFSP
jgi:hypothetical protein